MTRLNNPNNHIARAHLTDQRRSRWLIPLVPAALGAVILVATAMGGHILSGLVWFAVLSTIGALHRSPGGSKPNAAVWVMTRTSARRSSTRARCPSSAQSSSSRSRDLPPSRLRAERAPTHIPRSSRSAGSLTPSHRWRCDTKNDEYRQGTATAPRQHMPAERRPPSAGSSPGEAMQAVVESGRLSDAGLTTMLHRKLDWTDLEGVRWLLEHGPAPDGSCRPLRGGRVAPTLAGPDASRVRRVTEGYSSCAIRSPAGARAETPRWRDRGADQRRLSRPVRAAPGSAPPRSALRRRWRAA